MRRCSTIAKAKMAYLFTIINHILILILSFSLYLQAIDSLSSKDITNLYNASHTWIKGPYDVNKVSFVKPQYSGGDKRGDQFRAEIERRSKRAYQRDSDLKGSRVDGPDIPVVFVHKLGIKTTDFHGYVKESVHLAKALNRRLIFITIPPDHQKLEAQAQQSGIMSYINISGVTHISVSKIHSCFKGALKFESMYQHMSGNRLNFELISFQRYFVLECVMVSYHIEKVFLVDSDVLLFSNVTLDNNLFYHSCDALVISLKTPDQAGFVASAHSSYWNLKTLTAFTKYLEASYTTNIKDLEDIWDRYTASFKNSSIHFGGICDMTLLSRFVRMVQKSNSFTICNGIHSYYKNSGIFDVKRGFESSSFKQNLLGIPYFQLGNDRIIIKSLHFQGNSKSLLVGGVEGALAKLGKGNAFRTRKSNAITPGLAQTGDRRTPRLTKKKILKKKTAKQRGMRPTGKDKYPINEIESHNSLKGTSIQSNKQSQPEAG